MINDILNHYVQERQMPSDDRERRAVTTLYWLFRDVERTLAEGKRNATHKQTVNLMGKDVNVEILFFHFDTPQEFADFDFNNGDMVGYDPITNTFRFVGIWIDGRMSYRAVLRNLCLYVHDFAFLRKQPIEYSSRYFDIWLHSLMTPDDMFGVSVGLILHHSFPEMYISMGRNFFRDTLDKLTNTMMPYNGDVYPILYDICDKSDIFNSLMDVEESIKFIQSPQSRSAINEILKNCPTHSTIADVVAIGKVLTKNLKVMIGHLIYVLLLSSDYDTNIGTAVSLNDIDRWLEKNDPEAFDAEDEEGEAIYDF